MASVDLIVELIWQEEQTDLSECCNCGDVIYSTMHRLFTKVKNTTPTKIVICNSCKDCING